MLLGLWAASCDSSVPDDETLLLYARAQDVYREGRFAETAKMLAGETKFVPALVLRGKAQYLSGDLDAAGKTLKRALALKGNDTEASLFLARICRETGNPKEAQKLAEKILGDHPLDIGTLRFAAELARERGVSGQAASAVLLDRAVEASAESALVFLDRARLRWGGGNSPGALEDLRRASALLSDDSPVLKAVERLHSIISEVSP
jgi:predicted Zn-dependent protease